MSLQVYESMSLQVYVSRSLGVYGNNLSLSPQEMLTNAQKTFTSPHEKLHVNQKISLATLRQVALCWCLLSSTCQFWNRIPNSQNLPCSSQAGAEATELCIWVWFSTWNFSGCRGGRGWKEPGNMSLQRGRIFGLVLFKRKVIDQDVGPAGRRQSGAGVGKRFLVLLGII